jgi:copper transporter 1
MLFTWSTKNLCIVFESWQITSTFSLIYSLLAIVALGAGYELVRNITRNYEARANARLENIPRESLSPQ